MISIIIPVYNAEKYIDRCVKSIVEQTYDNLEILLLNDESKDNSLQKCTSWEKTDSRIRLINKKHGGVSSARNLGLEFVRGEYTMFVDSDDWIEHKTCEICLQKITQYKAQLCIYGHNTVDMNETLIEKCKYNCEKFFPSKQLPLCEFIKLRNIDCIDSTWGKLYQTELVKERRFDTELNLGEDLSYNLQLLFESSIVIIPELFYTYYQHSESLINGFVPSRSCDIIKIIKELYAYFLRYYPSGEWRVYLYQCICNEVAWACSRLHTKYKSLSDREIMDYFMPIVKDDFIWNYIQKSGNID
ncbi:MAG: glycosyltransferase family 2 protein [Christensenellaceae bacterium]|jgi:glycosyltransferase involved in cell wall biosynthesis|nr:glycosyltransferase family 2 protein [Christensenellaceae bacterium]